MNNLVINSSPHFRAPTVTRTVMGDVILALVPALIASVIIFGFRAFLLSAVCVAACILFEYAYCRMMKLPQTAGDLSAAITGLLLAFNLPVTFPLWQAAIGCFVAVVIVKQMFGGIGKNFANPAIVGRIVLLLSFATNMTKWQASVKYTTADAVTGATPLGVLKEGGALPNYLDMFMGNIGGSLGETCKLALLLGGIYLVARKVITVTTPVAFMGTVFIMSWALGADPVYQLLAGGVFIGAIFMATDYVTTPTTELGKLIFGVGCGIITVVIRLYAAYPEGVSFAILLMNILTPHIDNLTEHKAFGGAKA